MSGPLFSITVLMLFLGCGLALSRLKSLRRSRLVPRLTALFLYALLLVMGLRLSRELESFRQLGSIGFVALVFALATVLGTLAVLLSLFWLSGLIRKPRSQAPGPARAVQAKVDKSAARAHLREPLVLSACLIFGAVAGLLGPFAAFPAATASSWILRLLLLSVGIDLGLSSVTLRSAFTGREILLIPLGTAAGSLLGGYCAGLLLAMPANESLATAAGFGWYSLSGVLIADLGDPALGTAAFLANILRETIALLTIPLVAASRFPLLSLGLGGATSMDVTLPLIERCCGPRVVPLSIASGAILSLLVPVLVPLFYQLG